MTNKQQRMETLKQAGVNTDSFFDLSLRIPLNAEVKISVNGREMIATGGSFGGYTYDGTPIVSCAENVVASPSTSINVMDLLDDPIAQSIMDSGYVFNSRIDGRWITAQTFKMLNEKSYNYKTRQWESGWDAYLRNRYSYMYQFDMMVDELHRLSRMQRDNDTEFERLSSFFTKQVVYETCKHYIRQLKKFIRNQPTRKCRGVAYVRLNRYGNVFVRDLNDKVYIKLENALRSIDNSGNYAMLEKNLKAFMQVMVKLPYETPKCSLWKDAFKGKGAYVSLLNIVKFHDVKVVSYETGELLNRDQSVDYVERKTVDYKGEYWKFHELLKATIEANNFDLRKSIESQQD